jgi:methylenetetrahydrofolate reductase (NADPH)
MTVTPRLSFEFFPPRSVEASFKLWDAVRGLAPLNPDFVSVTYGAGGTTRKLTHEAACAIGGRTGLDVAAHLTCVDATRAETQAVARDYKAAGINRIVALRGDPPKGTDRFIPHPEGYASSVELIAGLREVADFQIWVGAYPDTHPEAASGDADIEWLKRKLDAGAHGAITQFFFEADSFFRFRDRCAKAGIDAPIVPGILPIEDWRKARKFALSCGTKVPKWLDDAFETAIRDNRHDLLAVAQATELASELTEGGVDHIHVYTLNRYELTRDIALALGVPHRANLRDVA